MGRCNRMLLQRSWELHSTEARLKRYLKYLSLLSLFISRRLLMVQVTPSFDVILCEHSTVPFINLDPETVVRPLCPISVNA
jgi:hypothetical protein